MKTLIFSTGLPGSTVSCIAPYLSTTGRTGLLFGNTVNCLLIDTSNKRSPIALSSCSKSQLHSDSQVFFLEEKGGAESKGGASGRAFVASSNVAWALIPASVPSCCIEFVVSSCLCYKRFFSSHSDFPLSLHLFIFYCFAS